MKNAFSSWCLSNIALREIILDLIKIRFEIIQPKLEKLKEQKYALSGLALEHPYFLASGEFTFAGKYPFQTVYPEGTTRRDLDIWMRGSLNWHPNLEQEIAYLFGARPFLDLTRVELLTLLGFVKSYNDIQEDKLVEYKSVT